MYVKGWQDVFGWLLTRSGLPIDSRPQPASSLKVGTTAAKLPTDEPMVTISLPLYRSGKP